MLKSILVLGRFTKSGVERVQSYLQIKQVQSKDQGFYRCRVDFFQAPTRNVKVKLSLIGKKNIIVNFCNMLNPMSTSTSLNINLANIYALKWIHRYAMQRAFF